MKKILTTTFLVIINITSALLLWFILDSEKSKTKTVVYDKILTCSEYDTQRGNKGTLFINRDCEVYWREYDDGITVTIKFNEDEKIN